MGRHSLRLVMVLGALVTLLGGTGVFATFSDRATGGENSAVSGARQSAADLQIAPATLVSGNFSCGTYTENTTTPQIVASSLQPSAGLRGTGYVCLQNVGAAALNLTAQAISLTDIDTACTGDEAASGDATCGSNGAGELSPALIAHVDVLNCTGGAAISGREDELSDLATTRMGVGTTSLAPTAVICLRLGIEYPLTTAEAIVQVAQSDTATWNFLFEGIAP